MTTIVSHAGSVGDHSQGGGFHRESESAAKAVAVTPAPDTASEDDVRLIIELDSGNGGFVYSTVDRRTGAVIRKLPRDGLLQLGAEAGYAAGSLIKTRA